MTAPVLILILGGGVLAGGAPPPAHDDCATPMAIAGEGEFPFVNLGATEVPLFDPCDYEVGTEDPYFHADVWYCWSSGESGWVTIDTCGSTAADTKIAVYEGCACPAETYLGCRDAGCADQSILEFQAFAGQDYLIRIGSEPGHGLETDTFQLARRRYDEIGMISCNPDAYPGVYSTICRSRSQWEALNSTRGQFEIMDDFVPQETGIISTICWAGTYLRDVAECVRHTEDSIEITYFADDCGAPGQPLGHTFSQSKGSLDVLGPAMTHREFPNGAQEFEFSAAHDYVYVEAGATYWVRITNASEDDCAWYWETNQDVGGYSLQIDHTQATTSIIKTDMAFCFDVHHRVADLCLDSGPVNDYCEAAEPLVTGTTPFETAHAGTDGPFHYYNQCQLPLGDTGIHKDIWYFVSHPCPGTLSLSTCNSDFDTRIGVYEDTGCNIFDWMAMFSCGEDECGLQGLQSVVQPVVFEDRSYQIRVGGYAGNWGTGELLVHYVPAQSSTLREFSAFTNCLHSVVGNDPSGGPDCCIAQDFDGDSDVDLLDAEALISAMTGPQ